MSLMMTVIFWIILKNIPVLRYIRHIEIITGNSNTKNNVVYGKIFNSLICLLFSFEDLSTASVAGIAVGAVVVGAVFGFIGFKKYQSYRRNRQEPMRFSRNDETRGSNENIIPVVSANDNSYNTVN